METGMTKGQEEFSLSHSSTWCFSSTDRNKETKPGRRWVRGGGNEGRERCFNLVNRFRSNGKLMGNFLAQNCCFEQSWSPGVLVERWPSLASWPVKAQNPKKMPPSVCVPAHTHTNQNRITTALSVSSSQQAMGLSSGSGQAWRAPRRAGPGTWPACRSAWSASLPVCPGEPLPPAHPAVEHIQKVPIRKLNSGLPILELKKKGIQ